MIIYGLKSNVVKKNYTISNIQTKILSNKFMFDKVVFGKSRVFLGPFLIELYIGGVSVKVMPIKRSFNIKVPDI